MVEERQPLLDDRASLYGSDDNVRKNDDDDAVVSVAVVRDEEDAEAAAAKRPPVRMVHIITPLAVGIFLAAMDGTIVASSYASIGSELKQLQNTSWIATGYMLTMTTFQPLFGKLSDIFGRKPCLIFAYAVFALGCLLCGMSQNLPQLIASRAIAGLGGGGMTTVVSILVSDVVPLQSRGTWQGVLNIVFASGSAAGAPLGGILADGIGWRWAFLIQVPFALLAILLVGTQLKLPRVVQGDLKAKLRRIDFTGAIFLIFAIFTFLLGLDRGGNVAWSDPFTLAALSASVILFIIFGVVETHSAIASEPFAPKRILINTSLLAAYLANFFGIASGISMMFHLALWFQAVAGKSASEAGLGLLPGILGSVCGSLLGGLIMQKTGKYYWLTVTTAMMMVVGNLLVVAFTGAVWLSVLGASIALAILSMGNGSGITTTLVALIANAAPEDQAIVTAVSYLFRSLGAVVGVSVGSTLVQGSLRSLLSRRLAGEDVDVDKIAELVRSSLAALGRLEPRIASIVRSSYEEAVRSAFNFSAALSVAGLICTLFIKEKPLVRK